MEPYMDPETLLSRRQAAEALSAAGYPVQPRQLSHAWPYGAGLRHFVVLVVVLCTAGAICSTGRNRGSQPR